MSFPKDILAENPSLSDWAILHSYRGSIAHGMYVPPSDPTSIDDKDTMAICVPPKEYYTGLKNFGSRGTKEIKDGIWDIVVYEARKALRLLAKGNPNMLAILWTSKKHHIKVSAAGQMLLDNRELFVGRHVYHHFTGYAHGQLHRMTHHSYNGHMGAKRKELVERFGYDTKNAAHLIRLLRMGIEFLKDGCLYVERKDVQELLAIKRGEWSLDKVKKEAERLFANSEEMFMKSDLPKETDRDAISKLCAEIVEMAWNGEK